MTIAAFALAIAAGAHLAAFPDHADQGEAVGGFFVVVAAVQLVSGLLVQRGAAGPVRSAVVVANVGVVGLWLWSRTLGVPFGAHAGQPEAVGALDLIATVAAGAAVAVMCIAPRRRGSRPKLSPGLSVLAIVVLVPVGGSQFVGGGHGHADSPRGADTGPRVRLATAGSSQPAPPNQPNACVSECAAPDVHYADGHSH